MNSLRTLQALNQVVNHDVCPQMKALIEENKRLIKKNNKLIKKQHRIMFQQKERLNDYKEWKDYFQSPEQGYFRCVGCNFICRHPYHPQAPGYFQYGNPVCEDCDNIDEETEDMENNPLFIWNEEEEGYEYIGNQNLV